MVNKNIMNTLWWVMRLHAEAGRARMVSVVSVGIIAGIAEYAEAALLGMAVERLTAGGGAANVLNIALAWASISLISLLASAFLGFLADDMGMRARTLIWGSFLRKAFDAPSSFFDKAHTGRSLRIAIAGTDAAFDLWSSTARAYIPSFLGLIVLLPLCFILNWQMATALLLIGVVSTAVSSAALRKSYSAQREVERIQSDATARAADLLANAPLVRAFGAAPRETLSVTKAFNIARQEQLRVARLWLIATSASRAAYAAATILMLLAGSALYAAGAASIGDVVTFLGLAALTSSRIEMLIHGSQQAAQRLAIVAQLVEFAGAPWMEASHSISEDLRARKKLSAKSASLSLRGVRFSYPGGREVLQGIDLEIAPGETVAVVGASGAGKSTLFSLIIGLRKPTAGFIGSDGVSIDKINLSEWRSRLSVVFQDAHLLNRSVADNITFGLPSATQPQVLHCAKALGVDNFVSKLPNGYATIVEESGASLSGGQRQRIAIARALIRDPDIVLLDEPTSALDAEGEAAVRSAIAHMRQGRTMLIIAHRLSTVAIADRVALLDEGRIVEHGKLPELLARSRRIRELFGLDE